MEKLIKNIKEIWSSCKKISMMTFNKTFNATNNFAKGVTSFFAIIIAGCSFVFLIAGVVLSSVSTLMIYEGYETISYLRRSGIQEATES